MSTRADSWVAVGVEADWEALYTAQLPRVYNFFRYRVGRTPDVEDLTSVTFEKAWRSRHGYRHDLAGFTTWLMTIARRVAIDYYRSRRDEAPIEVAAGVASTDRTAEQEAIRRSDADRLADLVASVTSREREILAFKYGADMTNREIAKVMALSESNVGTILHRTLERLRAEWDKGGS